MVQDVRSGTAGLVCDVSTAAGVTRALALVRAAAISSDEKRSLRDLLFLYTNSGLSDTGLRTLIETRLHDLPVDTAVTAPVEPPPPEKTTETPASQVVQPTTRSGFASARPRPQFGAVYAVSVSTPAAPVVKEMVPEPTVSAPSTTSTPVAPVNPSPTPVTVPSPLPVEPEEKAVVDAKLASVAPAPVSSVAYEPLYREETSIETFRARITEIKQMVNTRIGNPVNLVDIDNTLGREYMTTLLEAMKTVSGGGGDAVAVMNHLEQVVAKVMKLLDAQDVPTSAAPAVSAIASSADVVTKPLTSPIRPTIPVKVAPATPSATPVVTSSVQEEVVPVSSTVSPVASVATIVTAEAPVTEAPAPVPTSSRVDDVPTQPETFTEQKGYSVPIRNEEKIVVDPMTIASSRFKGVAPVSVADPLKTPADLPTPQELKAKMGIVDPLLDPDVDAGLEQLLSEWSLFKKSGMFGTGPRGRQHPLFIKLAPLTIPLILSGRFEGSTPEIKQSITDYMNGWRYEQGIVHNPDEVFEHYLRRVIRHIIDSQTRRRSA